MHCGLDRDHDRARRGGRHRRESGELRTRCSSPFRSPTSSFRTNTSSFHSALGGSLACSGAAFGHQDEAVPGRGLYVPMQRGLGPQGPAPANRDALNRSRREVRSAASQPPPRERRGSWQGAAQPPRFSVPAASYEAVREDALDCIVETLARQLPPNYGRALLLRRLSQGEYEVDGRRLGVGWQGAEVVALIPKEDGSTVAEPFASFLRNSADHALSRAYASASGAAQPGAGRRPGGSLSIAVGSGAGGAAPHGEGQQEVLRHYPTGTGSFLLRPNESGSFILQGREGSFGASSFGANSFYGVYGISSSGTPCAAGGLVGAAGGKDVRGGPAPAPLPIAPRGTAPAVANGQVPHPLQHCSTASFYMSMRGVPTPGCMADRTPSQAPMAVPPERRVGTPPPPSGGAACFANHFTGMGLVTPPRTALTQASIGHSPAQIYAPQFIAVNG